MLTEEQRDALVLPREIWDLLAGLGPAGRVVLDAQQTAQVQAEWAAALRRLEAEGDA